MGNTENMETLSTIDQQISGENTFHLWESFGCKQKPEDRWSCKRSPDYFPGINTTVKQEKILMSIKGCYSVANLQKMMLYNPNLDLVNDNVYTKFGHILLISSQDIE